MHLWYHLGYVDSVLFQFGVMLLLYVVLVLAHLRNPFFILMIPFFCLCRLSGLPFSDSLARCFFMVLSVAMIPPAFLLSLLKGAADSNCLGSMFAAAKLMTRQGGFSLFLCVGSCVCVLLVLAFIFHHDILPVVNVATTFIAPLSAVLCGWLWWALIEYPVEWATCPIVVKGTPPSPLFKVVRRIDTIKCMRPSVLASVLGLAVVFRLYVICGVGPCLKAALLAISFGGVEGAHWWTFFFITVRV